MTARVPARRLLSQAARALLVAAALTFFSPACYSAAGGTAPPTSAFYFPIGLAVSSGGNVLYAANSDFDLQWNGGTLQSYDLFHLRHDIATLINANFGDASAVAAATAGASKISFLNGSPFSGSPLTSRCLDSSVGVDPTSRSNGSRVPLGQSCAPPVDSAAYRQWSRVIGAFATDLQISRNGTRLFLPVRGDGTITWADVSTADDPNGVPNADLNWATPPGTQAGDASTVVLPSPADDGSGQTSVFGFNCGSGTRCNSTYQVGASPDSQDTRNVTLPGEPFAMAQTEDGTALAVTHQTAGQTSLLQTGLDNPLPASGVMAFPSPSSQGAVTCSRASGCRPSMQFVLSGVPSGGDGIVAIPHDPDGPVPPCELVFDRSPCVRPAFLETSHSAAEIELLRYYDDDRSSINRPFLVREAAYALAQNAADSRDIVIDASPRLACKRLGRGSAVDCAKIPARVFFASRSPASLVIGEIGQPPVTGDTTYDPDRFVITGITPLSAGPSRLYLAPIVDRSGHYALRLFIVCYDAAQVFIYDPDAGMVENIINVGPGPFAMAFDPFDPSDVAARAAVPTDPRQLPSLNLKRYRFAYLASFTQSYLQVLDLDDSIPQVSNVTFERIVFTLGQPTNPKGS